MFSGLVEEIGLVETVNRAGGALRLRIAAHRVLEGTRIGDSISVSGICLTVTRLDPDAFEVDMVRETAERTNLPGLRPGSRVNLERSLRLGDRIGGHFVLGHVDGTAKVVRLTGSGPGEIQIHLRCPAGLGSMIAEKGSVALDGVSLTVASVERDTFSVALIPHTRESTTLGSAAPGEDLNLEVDVLARYAARAGGSASGITEDWMKREGYL